MTSAASEPPLPAAVSQPVGRRRWWVTLGLVSLIFLAGMVTGGGLSAMFIHRALHQFLHQPQEIPDHVLPMLRRNLKLTDGQFVDVERIVRDHHRNLLQIRRETVPRIREEFESIDQEISQVLTDEQRREWKKRFDHVRQMWFPVSPPDPPQGTPD